MPPADNPLRDFLKREKLKASHIAPRFGVSEQTIHHWTSKGVPKTRLDFVLRTIADWHTSGGIGPRLVVNATEEQFNRWTRAWRDSPYDTIEQWAAQGLDDIAAEYFGPKSIPDPEILSVSKVADDPTDLPNLPRLGPRTYPKSATASK